MTMMMTMTMTMIISIYLTMRACYWPRSSPVSCCLCLQPRTETIDLQTDTSFVVDISDALSEQDKVKFTVHTKVGFILSEQVHAAR